MSRSTIGRLHTGCGIRRKPIRSSCRALQLIRSRWRWSARACVGRACCRCAPMSEERGALRAVDVVEGAPRGAARGLEREEEKGGGRRISSLLRGRCGRFESWKRDPNGCLDCKAGLGGEKEQDLPTTTHVLSATLPAPKGGAGGSNAGQEGSSLTAPKHKVLTHSRCPTEEPPKPWKAR